MIEFLQGYAIPVFVLSAIALVIGQFLDTKYRLLILGLSLIFLTLSVYLKGGADEKAKYIAETVSSVQKENKKSMDEIAKSNENSEEVTKDNIETKKEADNVTVNLSKDVEVNRENVRKSHVAKKAIISKNTVKSIEEKKVELDTTEKEYVDAQSKVNIDYAWSAYCSSGGLESYCKGVE